MPFWESNAFWGTIGGVLAIIGIITPFVAGKPKKALGYSISSVRLLSDGITPFPHLQIIIDGQLVRDLVSTKITFTNIGNQTLRSEDFARKGPLSIHLNNHSFNSKNAICLVSSTASSDVSISNERNGIFNINFQFLEKKQSITVCILHNGILSINGHIIDGRILEYHSSINLFSSPGSILILIFSLILVFAGVAIIFVHILLN